MQNHTSAKLIYRKTLQHHNHRNFTIHLSVGIHSIPILILILELNPFYFFYTIMALTINSLFITKNIERFKNKKSSRTEPLCLELNDYQKDLPNYILQSEPRHTCVFNCNEERIRIIGWPINKMRELLSNFTTWIKFWRLLITTCAIV